MFTPIGAGGRISAPRRGRMLRRVLGVIAGLALMAGTGAAVWRLAFAGAEGTDQVACPKPDARTTSGVPLRPQQIVVNVYNATTRDGLARRTAAQLKSRGFAVKRIGNDPLERHIRSAAEIRAGLKGATRVAVVQAHVPGATAVRDRRADATVDLVLGDAFRSLLSPAQAQALLTRTTTPPTPEPGSC